MDNIFNKLFNISFCRLFFSSILGFFGIISFFVLFDINFKHYIGNYDKITAPIVINLLKDIPFSIWIIIFFVFFIIGEIIALMGETISNMFFNFDLVINEDKNIVDKITPFSKENITFDDDFVKLIIDNNLSSMSQNHFELGRILAGLSLLLFLLSIKLNYNNMIILIYYLIIFIIIIYYYSNKDCKNMKITPKSLQFIITVAICLLSKYYNYLFLDSAIMFLLSINLFMFSISYRSFANSILKHSIK